MPNAVSIWILLISMAVEAVVIVSFFVCRTKRLNILPTEPLVGLSDSLAPPPNNTLKHSTLDFAASVVLTKSDERRASLGFEVATLRGSHHVESQTPRQDAVGMFSIDQHDFLIVSDGISSAAKSHLGSAFLISNLEIVLQKTLAEIEITNSDFWVRVNKSLRENFLAMTRARARQANEEVSADVVDLMRMAEENYAATLQLIWIDRSEVTLNELPYTFVHFAGDGSLFEVGETLERVYPESVSEKWVSGNYVDCLPSHNLPPTLVSRRIPRGSGIVLTTDGVGDFIEGDRGWIESLRQEIRNEFPTLSSLLALINHRNIEANDDRTVAIVKFEP